ncbi:hypothetical protein H0H92_015029 [Tricholoma furcatifolium]|nr:hypothetical protein H0H92_015029 [Tricholoma furcatifolium]
MADKRTLNTKEPQRLTKQLKKLFKFGSKSTPQSRSNSPPVMGGEPPVLVPPPVDALALIPPPLPIVVPPVDPVAPADLVSPNDPLLPIDPALISVEEAVKLRAKYTHFHIFVIGRANAGKTTLEDPVYNMRGSHNVYDEFIFKNNPGFIFHDSPGFEAGGEKELETVMSFIEEKAKSLEVMDQIHAIWE